VQNAIGSPQQVANPKAVKGVTRDGRCRQLGRVCEPGNADVPVSVAVLEVVKENRPTLFGDSSLQKPFSILLVGLTEDACVRVRSAENAGEPLKAEIAERGVTDIKRDLQAGQTQFVPNKLL
jgi:hypothetical protein